MSDWLHYKYIFNVVFSSCFYSHKQKCPHFQCRTFIHNIHNLEKVKRFRYIKTCELYLMRIKWPVYTNLNLNCSNRVRLSQPRSSPTGSTLRGTYTFNTSLPRGPRTGRDTNALRHPVPSFLRVWPLYTVGSKGHKRHNRKSSKLFISTTLKKKEDRKSKHLWPLHISSIY